MALLTLLGAALIVALGQRGDDRAQSSGSALGPSVVGGVDAAQPFNYVPAQRAAYERDAAAGLSRVLFAKSPGGIVASARRTAHWRPIVDRVARRHGLDANMLEAIVMLESAGRADARASDDLNSAVGLTQILAETGQNLLGLKIDVKASERLTRGILRGRRVRQREALRRRVDQRFDPAMAIEGAARYLDFAKGKLGRDDLAVVSYHMGVGNLQRALLAYGKGIVPYAQLYFDSSPLRHPAAWRKLASLGDDSATYLWRVLAAREVMRSYRADPKALQHEAVLQSHKASAEEVLHPPERHADVRRPLRHRPRPRVGRAARDRRQRPRALRAEARPGHGRPGAAHRPVPAPVPRAAPAGPGRAAGHGRRDAGDRGQRAADRDEHGARRALPARPGRDRRRRPRTPTRCTPPASPSTSRATTAAAPRRSPSSGCSTA